MCHRLVAYTQSPRTRNDRIWRIRSALGVIDLRVFFGIACLIASGVPAVVTTWLTVTLMPAVTIMPSKMRLHYIRTWMSGIVAASILFAFSPWLPGGGFSLALLVAALLLSCTAGSYPGQFAAAALLAVALFGLRGDALLQARLDPACNRVPLELTGEVASLPRKTAVRPGALRQRFEVMVRQITPAGCGGPRRVLLSYYGAQTIAPGQHWRFEVALRRPWGLSNPGSYNMQAWYTVSGIDAVGAVRGEAAARLDEASSIRFWHHRVRGTVSLAVDAAELSPFASAVIKALTVADRSGIDPALWNLFQQYGINHLLVISGLHVALVAGLALLLGRALRALLQGIVPTAARWPLPECLALLLALVYAAMAGFSVATLRALVMLACFLVSSMAGRNSSGFNNLLVAAFVLLVINPLAVVGSGFWLSFAAVAALLWMAQWTTRSGPVQRLLQPHIYMSLLMLPLGAIWFGGSSWVAAPANLLMVPLVGLVVVPLALLGAALSMFSHELAQWLWLMAARPLDALYAPAIVFAADNRFFLSLAPGLLAPVLGLFGLVMLLLPAGWRYRLAATVLLLVPLLPAATVRDATARLDALDVGQGTAIVFSAGGRALLYDTGGGDPAGPNIASTVILPWLRAGGIHALDTLVISHDDLDHSAGATTLRKAMPVKRYLVGERLRPGATQCRAGMAWQWPGGITFRVLSPVAGQAGNDASCVLLIDAQGLRVLLAGDIGIEQERELIRYWRDALHSDILVVGHHGSLTSTSQSWLNYVSPQWAVINAGYASRFGHPHAVVVGRLRAQGIALAETALTGALTFHAGADGSLQVQANRAGYQPWWM